MPVGNSATFRRVSGILERGDSALYHEVAGSGRPVLFIHAGVTDSRMWDGQFRAIEGWQLIRFDMRGYGKSRLGSERFINRDDALDLLDYLGIDSAVIVGCSIGGNTALQIAATAPERIDGLVLVATDAPGFDPEIEYESPEWPDAVAAFTAGDLQRAAELEAEIWLAGIGRTCSELPRETVDLFVEMDLIALNNETARNDLDIEEPLTELPELDAPVEVIIGARDIPQMAASAVHLATELGNGDPVVIEDTAHLPPMDQPLVFNTVLERFLSGL